jgi:glycine/D-amino acid oxidase-like deaminating enzyme
VCVTGLSGHGLALGPVLGEITADLALDGAIQRPIHPFRLARFREERVQTVRPDGGAGARGRQLGLVGP